MQELKERILKEGKVLPGNIVKVDGFLNHRIDCKLMADIADCVDDEMRRRVMKEIFYHLGRWIYLVDAADDFEKDAHSNCYNPLRYRYELDGDKLDEQSREAVAASLDLSVHRMASLRAALLRRVDKHFRQHFLRKPLWDRQCRSQGHVS